MRLNKNEQESDWIMYSYFTSMLKFEWSTIRQTVSKCARYIRKYAFYTCANRLLVSRRHGRAERRRTISAIDGVTTLLGTNFSLLYRQRACLKTQSLRFLPTTAQWYETTPPSKRCSTSIFAMSNALAATGRFGQEKVLFAMKFVRHICVRAFCFLPQNCGNLMRKIWSRSAEEGGRYQQKFLMSLFMPKSSRRAYNMDLLIEALVIASAFEYLMQSTVNVVRWVSL